MHTINHGKCTDFQLGCAGLMHFFNKVDIGHPRAHYTRVSPTPGLCKSVKVIEEKLYISDSCTTHEITQSCC